VGRKPGPKRGKAPGGKEESVNLGIRGERRGKTGRITLEPKTLRRNERLRPDQGREGKKPFFRGKKKRGVEQKVKSEGGSQEIKNPNRGETPLMRHKERDAGRRAFLRRKEKGKGHQTGDKRKKERIQASKSLFGGKK